MLFFSLKPFLMEGEPDGAGAGADLSGVAATIARLRESVESAKRSAQAGERRAAARDAMEKAGAINPDRDCVHITGKLVRGENGQWVLPSKGPFGEDTSVPVSEVASGYLDANPELANSRRREVQLTREQMIEETKAAFRANGLRGTFTGQARVIATNYPR